ncbi:MAG TPA: zf-TFIIB domain-containing protein [Polyangia bacterium]|jgi:Zn-finger nucleic acid-binding protein
MSEMLCCVKCTSILDKSMIGDIEVDLCPKCGGLWLDYGEVAKLAVLPEPELTPLHDLLQGAGGPPPVPSESKAHCPACPGDLKEVVLGRIHIDYCTKCKGMFLDQGELEAAIAAVRPKAKEAASRNVVAAVAAASKAAAEADAD